jgi:hypothetical protein
MDLSESEGDAGATPRSNSTSTSLSFKVEYGKEPERTYIIY